MTKESTVTFRLSPKLKAAAESYAADNGIKLSILAREALEARISCNCQTALPKDSLVLQDIINQIDYLYYLVDTDDTADDYAVNYLIRKEIKTLWKIRTRLAPSETLTLQQTAETES